MFLTESVKAKYDESVLNSSYLYEAVLEANEQYHDICMKMIKCEHYCIVNEDTQMLAEAEDEAKRSIKEVVKNLWKKFVEFLTNAKNWLVENLRKLGQFITKIPANVAGFIKGSLAKLKKHNEDLDTLNNVGSEEELENAKYATDTATEAEAAEETVDAKAAVDESKKIFAKLKGAMQKLNFFKALGKKAADKANEEGGEQEAKSRLSKITAAVNRGWSKVKAAFVAAWRVVANAIQSAGKFVADKTKAAATAVKAKMSKKAAKTEA